MNKTILLALASALLLSSTAFLLVSKSDLQATPNNVKITKDVIAQWLSYKSKYGLKFSGTDTEIYRMQIFAQNLQTIKNDKSGNLGVTPFAHLTQEEFAATYLNLIIEQPIINETTQNSVSDVEINVNWVTAGAVTAVKNQGQCGSCWAFSATGSFESALILAKQANNTLDLSEQQLIDCSILNAGCNGGLMNRAFIYIKLYGLTTEANSPYTATKQTCVKHTQDLYHLKGFQDVTQGSVDSLKTTLLQRPVSIAVDATNWSLYTNGVFSNCATTLNHGVLLVGFENDAWLVKNSWGTSWGESGYIRLANGNTCGLANAASYPTV